MSTVQRYILVVGLLVAAAIAHFSYCGWAIGGQFTFRSPVLIGFGGDYERAGQLPGTPTRPVYGCYAKADYTLSVIVGLILPWIGLTAAAFLWTGRKRAARREHGACLRCGYDLKYDYKSGCSECGWRRAI